MKMTPALKDQKTAVSPCQEFTAASQPKTPLPLSHSILFGLTAPPDAACAHSDFKTVCLDALQRNHCTEHPKSMQILTRAACLQNL
jgi:hypothetical protein